MDTSYQPFQPVLEGSGKQRFELSVQQLPAASCLSSIVHSYIQICTDKATPYPIIPDGTQAVFINSNFSMIAGAYSKSRDIQIPQAGTYFGIRFYPGALRHLFALDLCDITDEMVDSQFFPCQNFSQLHSRVYQHTSFRSRAKICEQWILRHFNATRRTAFDHALNFIYGRSGHINVATLAASVGLSSRHLNRLFTQHTGLNTKTFSQIIRIQAACKILSKNPNRSLEAAVELGYFDQAHLLKEYKQRLLINPRSFFERFGSDFYNMST